jgi:hypothetical protein
MKGAVAWLLVFVLSPLALSPVTTAPFSSYDPSLVIAGTAPRGFSRRESAADDAKPRTEYALSPVVPACRAPGRKRLISSFQGEIPRAATGRHFGLPCTSHFRLSLGVTPLLQVLRI